MSLFDDFLESTESVNLPRSVVDLHKDERNIDESTHNRNATKVYMHITSCTLC
jgi:hypothetical protein